VVEDRPGLGVELVVVGCRLTGCGRSGQERQRRRSFHFPRPVNAAHERTKAPALALKLEPLSQRANRDEVVVDQGELTRPGDRGAAQSMIRIVEGHARDGGSPIPDTVAMSLGLLRSDLIGRVAANGRRLLSALQPVPSRTRAREAFAKPLSHQSRVLT
jgi:hypothetical protein